MCGIAGIWGSVEDRALSHMMSLQRHRGPDGRFPPPPLNGTGHAWHHPKAVLHDVIKNGSPPGQGNMPAWRDRLTDEQIDDIIAWFQSQWPNQVYNAWYQMDQRSRQ